MLTIAYLANEFPSGVEPYVGEEISELRRRGVSVVSASVREPRISRAESRPDIVLQSCGLRVMLRGAWLLATRWRRIAGLLKRIVLSGREGVGKRVRALLHTFLGACYALELREGGIDHIHVHHGYFGSWVAMAAARLLGVPFSMTLHGSDLLLHGSYLDVKLENCATCFTVSEYNRRYILEHYPGVDPERVVVARLGVDVPDSGPASVAAKTLHGRPFTLVSVGRLHAVKDHEFLVRGCSRLKDAGMNFECCIAGDGPEWSRLKRLITDVGLEEQITLLGHVPRQQTASLYDRADVVVLTSRSEGIPLVLMEAMARGRVVLAPAITGIPELVIRGKTGFLYEPGSMDDFVHRLKLIYSSLRCAGNAQSGIPVRFRRSVLDWVRFGARVQVRHNFNRKKNLESFVDLLLVQVSPQFEGVPNEDLILQQV
jgi:colanic acid/amylovoran biosynthesis glycosyltransferase